MTQSYKSLACKLLALLVGLSAAATPALSQQPAPGLRVTANAVEIGIAGRVQTQFNTSSVDAVAASELILRRVRLGANVRVNDLVSGRVHVDFARNAVAIADAYMLLTFSPGFQVLTGRAYRPFALMEQTTSLQIIPIERGLAIRGVQDFDLSAIINGTGYGDRDFGVQLRGTPAGAPLGFGYSVGYFAGPSQNSAGNNQTQQFVARAFIVPIGRTRIGASWSHRDFVRQPVPSTFEVADGQAFAVDLEYGGPTPAPGVHLVAQAAMGDFDPFQGEEFEGAQAWLGYLIPVGGKVTVVEPLLRVSHADINRVSPTAPDGGLLVTPGVNIYLGGLNRLMINYDIWNGNRGPNAQGFKTQFQLTF